MSMMNPKLTYTMICAALAIFASGCATVATPVSRSVGPSQETMVQDAPINVRLKANLTSSSPAVGGFFSCLRLRTEPGSKWEVVEKEPLLAGVTQVTIKVGIGTDCTNAQWLLHTDGPGFGTDSKLEFAAGGGTYLILLKERGGYYSPFLFEVNRADAAAPFAAIAPGTPDLVAPAGTASTVANATGTKHAPGATFSDCPTCPQMVALPAGSFMMGSDASEQGREASEGPRHPVKISRSFAIGATEVTFDQYDACVKVHACTPAQDQGWGRGNRPVIHVSIDDAKKYVAWLSSTTGQSYFIPSEAEWEYAARAGTQSPWNTGDAVISEDANFLGQFKKTVPTGSYPPNGFGLQDMHGNVAEWVQDCLDTGYLGVPNDGSAAVSGTCATRIVRGGHFNSTHQHVRSAARLTATPTFRDTGTGFRVTRALPN